MTNPTSVRLSPRFRVAAAAALIGCLPVAALAQAPSAPARPAPVARTKAAAAPAATTQGSAQARPQTSAKPAGSDDVVARVGDSTISADEVRAYVAAQAPRDQAALVKDPALLAQAVRMMLASRLVLQEVAAKKWDQQPNIAEQLDRVRENAAAELYLQSVSVPPAGFPSEEDVQKVYDANRAQLVVPRQYQLSQIFIADPKDADKTTDEKARKKLDDVLKKVRVPGADFAAISGTDSETPGGGDLGWLAEPQIVPEIRTQIASLPKGGISEAVKLDDGWHILKLADTKASYTRPLSEVHDQLVQQIRTERATALRRAYLGELLKQHPPAINELELSKLFSEPTQAAR